MPAAAPPLPAFKCRYPILLLHGFLGFVERRIGPWRIVYYREVVPYLEAAGNRVYAIPVHPTQSIAYRAGQIRDFVESHSDLKDTPLNLIAHSMGGLDARYLTTRLDYGDRVKSLISLSSPHHGSLLADILGWVPGATALLPAIWDLTEKRMEGFNRETPDHEGTDYYCIPSGTTFRKCKVYMWPSLAFLNGLRGPNDGQVSVESATWGKKLMESDLDHLSLVGMASVLDRNKTQHLEVFRLITQTLGEQGY